MKTYKVIYWKNGNQCVAEIKASNAVEARYVFEMYVPNDGVTSIEEVTENV